MKYCIFLLFLLFGGKAFSQGKLTAKQEHEIDSLNIIIDGSIEDSLKLKAYLHWEKIITPIDPTLAIELNRKMWAICDSQLKDKSLDGQNHFFLNYGAASQTKMAASIAAKGDFISAIPNFENALSLAQRLGNHNMEAKCIYNIGVMYSYGGRVNDAIYQYKKYMALDSTYQDPMSLANVIGNLGTSYFELGHFAKSVEYSLQSIRMQETIGNKKGIANACSSLGSNYTQLGEHGLAQKYFKRCLLLRNEMDDKIGTAQIHINIGIDFKNTGKQDSALFHFNLALTRMTELKNKSGLANVYNNLAQLMEKKNEITMALEFSLKSLELRIELKEKRGLLFSTNYTAHLYDLLNDEQNALSYVQTALQLAEESGHIAQLRIAHKTLSRIYNKSGKIDSLNHHISKIKDVTMSDVELNYFTMAEHDKESFFGTIEDNFGYYFHFADKFGKINPFASDTAFNLTLMMKGLTLKSSSALRASILKSRDTALLHTYENWLKLKKRMSQSKTDELIKLERQSDSIEKELIKRSTVFSDYDKILKLNWRDVQKELKKNECIIEFINYETFLDSAKKNVYAALLVKKDLDHPIFVQLCNEDELESLLTRISGNDQSFVNALYGKRRELKSALYEKIWKPLDTHLIGIKKIQYSPSGLLHKISFAALTPTKNIFLCDLYELNQTGSTGATVLNKKKSFTENESYFLMGGVNYDTDSSKAYVWEFLPGTYAEAESINSLLNKKQHTVSYFADKFATEETLKENISNATVAHISTHGFFYPDPDEVKAESKKDTVFIADVKFRGATQYADFSFVKNKNPLMRSGLVLAGANAVWQRDPFAEGEDGILTAQEVSGLDLSKTKLVVLSACETGLGDIKGSEGVFGLQRAFKIAGANKIIMSLWQLPDKETAEFMKLFYANLEIEVNIDDAFHKTQNTMRKKYDPYFWGAFVLIE